MFVRHADRLRELIGAYGWPTATRVGEQAARGAWLVAQHADTQLDVQRLAVRPLSQAVARGEVSQRDLAFLEDRLAANEGRYQVYGTQITEVINGRPVPWPCLDPSTSTSDAPTSASSRSPSSQPATSRSLNASRLTNL